MVRANYGWGLGNDASRLWAIPLCLGYAIMWPILTLPLLDKEFRKNTFHSRWEVALHIAMGIPFTLWLVLTIWFSWFHNT